MQSEKGTKAFSCTHLDTTGTSEWAQVESILHFELPLTLLPHRFTGSCVTSLASCSRVWTDLNIVTTMVLPAKLIPGTGSAPVFPGWPRSGAKQNSWISINTSSPHITQALFNGRSSYNYILGTQELKCLIYSYFPCICLTRSQQLAPVGPVPTST